MIIVRIGGCHYMGGLSLNEFRINAQSADLEIH